jgi:hypothetical protein
MPPEEICNYLHAAPFEPFRLHLTDGRHIDVRHPDNLLLTRRVAVVGVSDVTNAAFPDRTETIALIHIVSVTPLGQPAGA